MGLGTFIAEAWGAAIKLTTDTPRPYFLRSVKLVNDFRAVQLHYEKQRHSMAEVDEGDLQKIFKTIQDTLSLSNDPALKSSLDPDIDKAFEKAHAEIDKYLGRKFIKPHLPMDFQSAYEGDEYATKHLAAVSRLVEKRCLIIRAFEKMTFNITFWPEEIRRPVNGGMNWNSHTIQFVIEKQATLDVALLRILGADIPELNRPILLSQNPQFFGVFPINISAFCEGIIRPLGLWEEVKDNARAHGCLQLIVDQTKNLTPLSVVNGLHGPLLSTMLQMSNGCRNLWQLDVSDRRHYVARDPAGILRLLDISKPPPAKPPPKPPAIPTVYSDSSTTLGAPPFPPPQIGELESDIGQYRHPNQRPPNSPPTGSIKAPSALSLQSFGSDTTLANEIPEALPSIRHRSTPQQTLANATATTPSLPQVQLDRTRPPPPSITGPAATLSYPSNGLTNSTQTQPVPNPQPPKDRLPPPSNPGSSSRAQLTNMHSSSTSKAATGSATSTNTPLGPAPRTTERPPTSNSIKPDPIHQEEAKHPSQPKIPTPIPKAMPSATNSSQRRPGVQPLTTPQPSAGPSTVGSSTTTLVSTPPPQAGSSSTSSKKKKGPKFEGTANAHSGLGMTMVETESTEKTTGMRAWFKKKLEKIAGEK